MAMNVLIAAVVAGTVSVCVLAIQTKRALVRGWRRFLVRLELDAAEHARFTDF